jgi:hypothetical protein
MRASDRYKIALNIAAKLGLDHPQFITEYSRAVSITQMMDSASSMTPPPPMPMQGAPVAPVEGQSPQGMPEQQIMSQETPGMV